MLSSMLIRGPCVEEILHSFLESKQKNKEITLEVLEGVKLYFRSTLGLQLLYAQERTQYSNVKDKGIDVTEVYGVEHLLRLFVKLPSYVEETGIEEQTMATLQTKLNDLLKFIQKNIAQYTSSQAYTNKEAAENITKASLQAK